MLEHNMDRSQPYVVAAAAAAAVVQIGMLEMGNNPGLDCSITDESIEQPLWIVFSLFPTSNSYQDVPLYSYISE